MDAPMMSEKKEFFSRGLILLQDRDLAKQGIITNDMLLIVEMIGDHASDIDGQGPIFQ